MRDQGEVACLPFDGLGAHPLGHEAFQIGIVRPVVRGNGIETRLRPPGRMRGLVREQSLLERLLDRIENLRLRFGRSPAKSRRNAASLRRPSSPSKTIPADAGGVGNVLANAV